jgi:hypothetical protein
MKKLLATVVAALFLTTTAYGITLQLGVDTDFVLDRDVDLQNFGTSAGYSAQHYDLTLETMIGDWLHITPKAGLSHFNLETDAQLGFLGTEVELNGGIGWNAGIDIQADVYQFNMPTRDANKDLYIMDVSLIGGYRFSRVDVDEVEVGALKIDNPIESIMGVHEWELGAIVSRDCKDLGMPVTPYFGMVYSDLRGEMDANLSIVNIDEEIEAENKFGLRVGVAGEPIKDLKVSLDCKFVDQTAVGAKVTYKF